VKIERSGQTLTIKETPGCLWIFGLFFASIGAMFVYGALGGYSNYDQAARWIIAAHLFGGLCAIAAGYWIVYKAPITRITIDRSAETVTYKKKGLSGRSDRVLRFSEIERFLVLEDRDDDGDPIYSLAFELADGEVVSISAISSLVESFKRDFVFQANEFLYKQMPSYRTANELEDET
jgi:hypothetical protein